MHPAWRRHGGFTLIELLVAIAAMALISVLSWRGLDSMVQTQAHTQQRSDAVMALQTGLAQWSTDLDALAPTPRLTALDWDGRALRLTRRAALADAGLQVVAWSRRDDPHGGQWLRWQSAPLRTQGDWQAAWQQAALWAQNPGELERRSEVAISALAQWQIFYYRADAWTHPLSSAQGSASTSPGTPAAAAELPDGVRLVLTLPPGQALSGTLTRDWLRPTLGGNKS